MKEVEELLDKLDQPAGMVLLEMEIGEAPVAAVKAVISSKPTEKSPAAAGEPVRLPQRPEKMETIGCARVVTLDNQPAFVQMGSRVPLLNDAIGLVSERSNEAEFPSDFLSKRGTDPPLHAAHQPRRRS